MSKAVVANARRRAGRAQDPALILGIMRSPHSVRYVKESCVVIEQVVRAMAVLRFAATADLTQIDINME